MNFIREEVNNLKEDINGLREELIDYKEENNKKLEKYENNRKDDRKFLLDILVQYDIAISQQLGDHNVDKMRKFV